MTVIKQKIPPIFLYNNNASNLPSWKNAHKRNERLKSLGKTILTFFTDFEVNQGADGDGCGLESPTTLPVN